MNGVIALKVMPRLLLMRLPSKYKKKYENFSLFNISKDSRCRFTVFTPSARHFGKEDQICKQYGTSVTTCVALSRCGTDGQNRELNCDVH